MSSESEKTKDSPLGDWGHSTDTVRGKMRHTHWQIQDALRWAQQYQSGKSILQIAAEEHVDQSTVSQWLHRLGLDIKQGSHRVQQPPLQYSNVFIELVDHGPEKVLQFVRERVWGIMATEKGIKKLNDFCEFFQLHRQGIGVKEAARKLGVHRSTIAEWREATDQPYLAKIANSSLNFAPLEHGWKLLPMHMSSGANELTDWVTIPDRMRSNEDITKVLEQLQPLSRTHERAKQFGLSEQNIQQMRTDLFAYCLGTMLGDGGKSGGDQQRLPSMSIDLQFIMKKTTNQHLGEFVSMCMNNLGLVMERVGNKPPTGDTRKGKHPMPAYRWISERSPVLAWMFSVGLGLNLNQTTTEHPVHMDWIFSMPYSFRKQFVQALGDSDGTVRPYTVEITSVPNAEFLTKLLHSLGLKTAFTRLENGKPLRTVVHNKEAVKLPIFNEFVKGYRYQKLQQYA
jgi:transposase-like protein